MVGISIITNGWGKPFSQGKGCISPVRARAVGWHYLACFHELAARHLSSQCSVTVRCFLRNSRLETGCHFSRLSRALVFVQDDFDVTLMDLHASDTTSWIPTNCPRPCESGWVEPLTKNIPLVFERALKIASICVCKLLGFSF